MVCACQPVCAVAWVNVQGSCPTHQFSFLLEVPPSSPSAPFQEQIFPGTSSFSS